MKFNAVFSDAIDVFKVTVSWIRTKPRETSLSQEIYNMRRRKAAIAAINRSGKFQHLPTDQRSMMQRIRETAREKYNESKSQPTIKEIQYD